MFREVLFVHKRTAKSVQTAAHPPRRHPPPRYPHTSGWDMFYGMFLIFATTGSKVMVKSSLSWMRFLGIPVLSVQRNKNSNQTAALAHSFKQHKRCWLWLWISGTRKKSDHVSSGFYFIAKSAGVPIVFGSLDYRSKKMIASEPYDPSKFSKEEILEKYIEWAGKHKLEGAGYIPSNASTLRYK